MRPRDTHDQRAARHHLPEPGRCPAAPGGWVFPVVIGSGKRLFADGAVPAGLRLVDSTVASTGVFIGTYDPAGELVTGSMVDDADQR